MVGEISFRFGVKVMIVCIGGVGEPRIIVRAPKKKQCNFTQNLLNFCLQKHATTPNNGSVEL